MNRRYLALEDAFGATTSSSGSDDDQELTQTSPLQEHMRMILSTADMSKLLVVTDNAHTTVNMHSTHARSRPQRFVHRSRSSDSIWYGVASPMDKATTRWAASSDSSLALMSPRRRRMPTLFGDNSRHLQNADTAAPRKPTRAPENAHERAKTTPSRSKLKVTPDKYISPQNALSHQKRDEFFLCFSPQTNATSTTEHFTGAGMEAASNHHHMSLIESTPSSSTLSNRLPSVAADLSNALMNTQLDSASPSNDESCLLHHIDDQVWLASPFRGLSNPRLLRHCSDSILELPKRQSSSSYASSANETTSSLEFNSDKEDFKEASKPGNQSDHDNFSDEDGNDAVDRSSSCNDSLPKLV